MVFSSSIFIFLFLPISVSGYYLLRGKELKNIFLLLMSLLFYAWGEPAFVVLLMLSVVINYWIARVIDAKRDNKLWTKIAMIIMVVWNFGMFFIFKYLVFTMTNLNKLFGAEWNIPDIELPIGISFFTFQAVSYVMDVKRKNCEVQKNIFDLALYITFFPQLVAGPIVRYSTVAKQLRERQETLDLFYSGTKRFIIGLCKKSIFANIFGEIADTVFALQGQDLTVGLAWLGGIGYTLQLFFDFAGYSDMAIGLGRMFGFEFEENFNYPYIARSIREYWRRWHMSLGAWFREYVFYPVTTSRWLGRFNKKVKNKFGFKVSRKIALAIPLFITWMATGIWHGATWNYVIWGFYFSFLIIVENLGFDKKLEKMPRFFQHAYVTIIMLIARVIVRTSSVKEFCFYMRSMIGVGNSFTNGQTAMMWINYAFVIVLGVIFCIPIVPWTRKKLEQYELAKMAINLAEPVVYIVLLVVGISFVVGSSYNPFIYFNF